MCGMHKEKRTEVVTLRLKPSTKAGLQALADADRRPFATFLAMILEDAFEAQQQRAAEAKSGRSRRPER
jgi:predicted transcriptional regulator